MADPQRLMRIARAQGALSGALELRLAAEERKLSALEADRISLLALMERDTGVALSIRSQALQRTVAMEAGIVAARASVTELQRQLLMARGREKSMVRRARALEAALTRMAEQLSIQETVQTAAAKASRKTDVVD